MNEREFQQLLELFPVVRSRNCCAESESSTSRIAQRDDERIEWKDASSAGVSYEDSITDLINEDSFWEKLRLSAEKKVVISRMEDEVEKLKGAAARFGKTYLKVAKSYNEKGEDYARNEIQRLQRMLEKSISTSKAEEFFIKKNILSTFSA